MSYKLKYTGEQIDNILDRAVEGGTIDDALALKAPLESPALTGTPTAPTQAEGDDSTKVATTAYADRAADAAEAAAEAAAKEYTDAATGALYITDTASGSIASFSDGADGVAMRSVKASIEPVQSGSGDPSPDNVRPISGWTGAEINVTAVNIYDQQWELGSINPTTGALVDNTSQIRSKNKIPVYPSTAYRFLFVDGATNVIGIHAYDADDNWLGMYDPDQNAWRKTGGGIGYITNRPVFTTPANTAFIRFGVGGRTTYTKGQISINTPSTVIDYMPFGTTYPVSWETQAGTVYGGTLDAVSGELKVTHGWREADGTENVTGPVGNTGIYQRFYFTSGFPDIISGSSSDYVLCSQLKSDSSSATVGGNIDNRGAWCTVFNGNVRVGVPFATSTLFKQWLADMKTAGTPVQFAYTLATPVIYQLTPQQITSLLGQNNVWSNTGDTEVEYVADPKLYIAKMLGGGALTLGSASPLSLNRPVTISKEDLEQAGEVSEAVEAATETVLPAESGETEEGAQE